MNPSPRQLTLKRILIKDQPVLALDTGFDADSAEGRRLVKASRGAGWFFRDGKLSPWTTRGVVQEGRSLVIWGDAAGTPEGRSPETWPRKGREGRDFLRAFVEAWTVRAQRNEPLDPFSPSSVLPFQTSSGWAFAFLPGDLREVLDSLQTVGERLAWEPFCHPDFRGGASWAFASAALGVEQASGFLPWSQSDEAQLRQEVRDLKKTLALEELPTGPESWRRLWFDSLTGRGGSPDQWRSWASQETRENGAEDPEQIRQRGLALARRERRRHQIAFWRRKGTLVLSLVAVAAAVLVVVGSVVWGAVKPDPTDTWTPEQVVKGYYAALSSLNDQQLGKLTSFDTSKEPVLGQDRDEVTNRYVIRQVRTAYESKNPFTDASVWENAGRPPLILGQSLYGLAGLQIEGSGAQWTVRYRKWISEGGDDKIPPRASGAAVVDQLVLEKTRRGWKVSSLHRQSQPLP
jgi:hypothetical protein